MASTISNKRKFSNINTVTLFVGSEKSRFDVHQDQLCEASTFFNAAFTSQFKEGAEKTLELLEDDADTVDLLIQWLYKDKCELFTAPFGEIGYYYMQPMRLLVFADKYDIKALQLHAFTQVLAHLKWPESRTPAALVVQYVYSNTCAGSGIRRMMTDSYTTTLDAGFFREQESQDWLLGNPEFAVDLVAAFSSIVDASKASKNVKMKLAEHYMEQQAGTSPESSTNGSKGTVQG